MFETWRGGEMVTSIKCSAFLLMLILYFCPIANAATGYINSKLTACPTVGGAMVYDEKGNEIGGIPEKNTVETDPQRKLSGYYWVESVSYEGGDIEGFVVKGCVSLGMPPAPPHLRAGTVNVFPLDLGDTYEITIGAQTALCTAKSTKELSCPSLMSDFMAIIAGQAGHEYLLGCQSDNFETCANLSVGTYSITVHGRTATFWHTGMQRINIQTGKRIGSITPVFSILVLIK
jgi:hypothetical protein